METDRLKQLQVVSQTLNLRKAAELLHISPGGLSKSLKTLEDELGIRLFTMQGRSLQLSDPAKELLKKVPTLLEKVQDLKVNLSSKPEFIKIATFEVFSTYFLKSLVQSLGRDTRLELLELTPGHLEQALIDKRADLGITYIPIPRKGLDYTKVGAVEMAIFGRPIFKSAKCLKELPFAIPITPISDAPTDVRGLDGWPDHEVSRNIYFRVELMESALELCRQGIAVGYFPSVIVDLHNETVASTYQLHKIDFPIDAKIKPQKKPVYLVRRSGNSEGPIHKKTARAIRLICKSDT